MVQSPAVTVRACVACARPSPREGLLCTRCTDGLLELSPVLGGGPPGLDRAWSFAPHETVAADLVAALEGEHCGLVAGLMAECIDWTAPAHMLSGTIVPVPHAAESGLHGNAGQAEELASALADRIETDIEPCLELRRTASPNHAMDSGSSQPPDIRATGVAPRNVMLVNTVLGDGLTLTTSAKALRAAGASRVVALTFTRR